MLYHVDWMTILQMYLLICLAWLYFSQKKRLLGLQQRIEELENRLQASGAKTDEKAKP